ncbi:E3 ubiquitin-protein ligase TRIM62 isoform X1 [Amia ocellicauda]|uniref:E3 ubiquitin-protein ligase TRIM62 isoform X1 n=2 Tax=Amia ocellicauda TaxID=2972642 RepID=UPI003463B2CF
MMAEKEQSTSPCSHGKEDAGNTEGLAHSLQHPEGNREPSQPFPRSPNLARKQQSSPKVGRRSEAGLSRLLQELSEEESKASAHIQSLKKQSANLNDTAGAMKQQVSDSYAALREALRRDEEAMLQAIDEDTRGTVAKLDKVAKDWRQHLAQVQKAKAHTQAALQQIKAGTVLQDTPEDQSCPKKKDGAEQSIKLNEGRFHRLLKILHNISKDLDTQLQRKCLLLDSSAVTVDSSTCHRSITVCRDGRGLCFSAEPQPMSDCPLRFDRVRCALGGSGFAKGRHYWEVQVGCCSEWAVGAAYGCIERRGNLKGAKPGRNRHSWCLELRDSQLSAWHNDRSAACRRAGPGGIVRRVGVFLDYEKGRLAFYNAGTMQLLQEFSGAYSAAFDRMQHQFTEPLFPVFRFFQPGPGQLRPSHMEICPPEV